MTQSNRLGSMLLAISAGLIGLTLALTSLAHNIEGVLPRISAVPGTFEYFIQMIMEGGATVGLNMVALFGFTFATLMLADKNFGKSFGLVIVAILAMLWSGTTQLGVIAEKTFHVSGSKSSALAQYKRALAHEAEINAAMPSSHKYMGEAQQDVRTALAALKSHRYGKKTAWQTTNNCTGDITAPTSVSLCRTYNRAVRALETSKYAASLEKRRVAVNAIIAKGQPQTIDAGPELIAAASMGILSIKNVQVILVFLRSFGIDLAAGLFLAASFSIWPSSLGASVAHQQPRQSDGGLGVQADEPGQPDTPKNTRVHTQQVINDLKQSVQNTEHAQNSVFKALQTLSIDGEFKTNYRDISACTKASDGYGVATGALNDVLKSLCDRGLIERYSSKGKGTCGRILVHEHAYA